VALRGQAEAQLDLGEPLGCGVGLGLLR
jgi:hypothetical protein